MTRLRLKRSCVTLCLVAIPLGLLPGLAGAYWTAAGQGAGSATTGTLGAPQDVTATPNSSTSVEVQWTAPVGQAPTGYRVTRDDAAPGCEVTAPATSCTVTGLSPSTSYSFVVTALLGSWTASAPAVTATTQAAPVTDTTPPAVTITSTPPPLSNNASPQFSGAYGVAPGDNAAISVQMFTGSSALGGPVAAMIDSVNKTWSVGFGPLADGSYRIDAVQEDQAGNTGTVSSGVFVIDGSALTATVNQAATQADPTNASPIRFAVQFNKPVSDFTASDVALGGTAGGTKTATVTGSGASYEVAVAGMTGTGTITASVAAGVATDGAGNTNAAATSTDNVVTYDGVAPTVTVNQAVDQVDPTNNPTIRFTAVFNEAVTGLEPADITLGGTASPANVAITGSGTTYTLTVSGMTAQGTVTAAVIAGAAADQAGNTSSASSSTDNQVLYDSQAPTVLTAQKGSTGNTSGNNAQRERFSGTTTEGTGTLTVRVYTSSGSLHKTYTVTTFSTNGSSFDWGVDTNHNDLATGTPYRAEVAHTDAAGNTSPVKEIPSFTGN